MYIDCQLNQIEILKDLGIEILHKDIHECCRTVCLPLLTITPSHNLKPIHAPCHTRNSQTIYPYLHIFRYHLRPTNSTLPANQPLTIPKEPIPSFPHTPPLPQHQSPHHPFLLEEFLRDDNRGRYAVITVSVRFSQQKQNPGFHAN